MKTAIWWIRRDLRLCDNQALQEALENAEQVLPVFILDEKLLNSAYIGEKRLKFLFAGLRQLDADLQLRGSRLVVRQGEPLCELTRLVRKRMLGVSMQSRTIRHMHAREMHASLGNWTCIGAAARRCLLREACSSPTGNPSRSLHPTAGYGVKSSHCRLDFGSSAPSIFHLPLAFHRFQSRMHHRSTPHPFPGW